VDEVDDYPELGDCRHGRTLVCHGDDRPESFVDWLDPLVGEFITLRDAAENLEIVLETVAGQPVEDVGEFCRSIGIQLDSNFWEGSFISGYYYFGWIEIGAEQQVQEQAQRLLEKLSGDLETKTRQWQKKERASIIRELKAIEDFDQFAARTADDRDELSERINRLENDLQVTGEALDAATAELNSWRENDSHEVDRGCMQLLIAMALKTSQHCVAGPLALWDDGVIYAITQIGPTHLPSSSTYAWLLQQFEAVGLQVVKVKEMTVLGGRASGPIHYPGGTRAKDWVKAWSEGERSTSRLPRSPQETKPRQFLVDPPEYGERVRTIHQTLRMNAPADKIS
jgi:hypothetical protein